MHRSVSSRRASTALAIAAAIATAACGGGNAKPSDVVSLATLSLNPKTIAGGSSVIGTATLTAPATGSGALVSLSSTDRSLALPPESVTVTTGSTSATFTVTTTGISTASSPTIGGAFGGESRSDTLLVTPPSIVPKMVITGPSGNNTCRLNDGGGTLDCTFDGRTSTGAIASYTWDYVLGRNSLSVQSGNGNPLTPGTGACGLFAGETSRGANTNLEMRVTLTVRDGASLTVPSPPLSVTVIPRAGACGF